MMEAFRRFYISIPLAIFLILILLYIFYGNIRNVLLTCRCSDLLRYSVDWSAY